MYVVLSRVTSIDNLFLIGKYNRNVFKVNDSAVAEYNRFDTINTNYVDCNSLTVSLLNTQSLKRHAGDLSRARQFTEDDVLCLSESQITNDTDMAEIKEQLSKCGVRHKNLAFCLGRNIVLSKHETFPGISVIDITKTSFSHNTMRIILLYRSPGSSLTTFYNTLENLLTDHPTIG